MCVVCRCPVPHQNGRCAYCRKLGLADFAGPADFQWNAVAVGMVSVREKPGRMRRTHAEARRLDV